ncbi:conserved hypothetical protein [Beggiatoa sp. PS]|nr:conserved hypothetical protein [Beggiatoa sp. PS]
MGFTHPLFIISGSNAPVLESLYEAYTMTILQRQFITNTKGLPIGILLPLEEYRLVEPILKQHTQIIDSDADKLKQMEQAPFDARFMADLSEVMSDFAEVDTEWWDTKK